MPEFILGRDKVVATLSGHRIKFVKDEPTFVPLVAVPDVMQIGAVPVDGEVQIDDEDTQSTVNSGANLDHETRKLRIVEAFESIVKSNQRADFSADGKPHPKAVSRVCGFTVEAKERNAVWAEFMDKE